MGSILKAAGLGVPLPLCSCSVIPVSMALRRHGASPGATTAFLLSTPQTGVDSIAVTYGLLGWPLALFRAAFALVTGVVGGFVTDLAVKDPDEGNAKRTGDDCHTHGGESVLRRFFRYALITMPRDIGGSLLMGVVISGILTAAIPAGELQAYLGSGILGILVMVAISVPLYVCATASVPIALSLIHLGASPGAALAFLIAGPATNSATVLAVLKVLGKKAMIVYLATVAVAALAAGLLFDGLFSGIGETVATSHVHPGMESPSWFAQASAGFLLLLFVLVNPRVQAVFRRFAASPKLVSEGVNASAVTLHVIGMTCTHCERTIQSTLLACSGVVRVEVDRPSETVVAYGDTVDMDELLSAVEQAGFSGEAVSSS